MAARKGCPCLSRAIVVPRWVVITTPAMLLFGMSVLRQSCWQAWHSVCQNASGSLSTQPGCTDR